jgi:hypothetical protein
MARAKTKTKKTAKKTKPAKAKKPAKAAKPVKIKKPKAKARLAAPKSPAAVRQFRFTAIDTVSILFAGQKKAETFRVDDMVEASMVTLEGPLKHYYQYRLVSQDRTNPDGTDRVFWFFDAKPVGAADPIDPSLWRQAASDAMDGLDVVKAHSGNFSTKSVTSYDGSGARHVVRLHATPTYRMRLDLNGKREFLEGGRIEIRKGDVLFAKDV